jgi:hypothetical protein
LAAAAVATLSLLLGAFVAFGRGGPARGQVFDVRLLPETAVNPVGTEHTLTFSASESPGTPLTGAGAGLSYEVIEGPNAGATGAGSSWTYTGNGGPGTDTILACFLQEFCDTATKTWVEPSPTPTAAPTADPTPSPTEADVAELEDLTGFDLGSDTDRGSGFPWLHSALLLGGAGLSVLTLAILLGKRPH